MINKADEYLRLVCGYTESLLLQQYNINNVHEKIKTFIEKSIKYKKEYISPPQEVVEKFPVL